MHQAQTDTWHPGYEKEAEKAVQEMERVRQLKELRLNLSTILSRKRGPLAVLSKAQRKAVSQLKREIAELEGAPARREYAMSYPVRMTIVAILDDPETPHWKRLHARQVLNRVPLRYNDLDRQRLGLPVAKAA